MLKYALQEMQYELQCSRLEVILIPQRDPVNVGACIRAAASFNCEWYRRLCADYESNRKRKYRKFKTRVKRKNIERILSRLIDGKESNSIYAEWIIAYAQNHILKEINYEH
ncbi:MAG: hypothetical protein HPZ91_07325 [Lentisphaeria bacterium]|nr:hypothetical protein [Lentisphaeria bacterium]